MIPITLLGTSCMAPTKERNVTGIYLEYKGEGMLFDCGEGTQRQMAIAGLNRNKVKKIFISHWHGDHVAGLLGLVQTLSSNEDNTTLEIFGPKETKKRFKSLMDASYFDNQLDITITEITSTKLTTISENEDYFVQAIPLDHGIPCLAYSFIEKDRLRVKVTETKKLGIPDGPLLGKLQERKNITFKGKKYNYKDLTYDVKGKKIAIVMDTAYTKNILTIADEADLLISEATYMDKHADRGEKHKHLTITQIAQAAHSAQVGKLVMMHFSQRYKDMQELEDEAKEIFPESHIGYDFMKIKV